MSDRDQQFCGDALVNLELGVGLEIVPNRSLRIVARPPGAIGILVCGHVLDQRVKDDAVTSDRRKRRIKLQFAPDMIMGMV